MDAMRTSSGRRKHPSSPPSRPLLPISTRTRSQAHLSPHQNRACHLRSDSARGSDDEDDFLLIRDLCKKAKLNQESSVGDDDEPSRVLIKDLRARRVYSPQSLGGSHSSSSQNVDPQESRVGSSCADQKMDDSVIGSASNTGNSGRTVELSKKTGRTDNLGEVRGKDEVNSILCSILKEYQSEKDDSLYVHDALETRNEETESPVVGFAHKAQNLDHVNRELLDEGQKLQYVDGVNGGRDAFERIDDLNELGKLTTPPDVEICGNLKVNADGGKQVEGIHVKDTQLTGNDEANTEELSSTKANNKIDSVLQRKTVLRPRLQRKLFKTPGSVSYRRLLPYLMNMTQDNSGTSIMGRHQNDEKPFDAKQLQVPLSSQSQEASKDKVKTDSCFVRESVESRAFTDCSDLSGGNQSKLISHEELPEFSSQLIAEEVAHDCSFVPPANEHIENVQIRLKCSSNTKADLALNFSCDRGVANAVHNDDFKQEHSNAPGGNSEAIDSGGTSESICASNQECLSIPDADVRGEDKNSSASPDHVNSMDLTGSAQANAGWGSCPKAMEGKDHVLNSKPVLKPCLQGKLFKSPGSFSYKRLLPFIMDIAKDDCGAPKLDHHRKDEMAVFTERSQLPFHGEKAPIDKHKTESCHMQDNVEQSNVIKNNIIVDLANEQSYGNQPKLASSQVLHEFPVQSNPKGVIQESVCAPLVMRDVSEPKTTLVLNPCQQIELLKHSGSISYRRMLPFLKNITKYNSSNNHNPKLEKGLNETTPPPSSTLGNQVTLVNDPNGCIVPMENGMGNSATQQKASSGPDDSLKNNNSPEAVSSVDISEYPSKQDSCKLKDKRVLLNEDGKLGSSPDLPTSVVGIDSQIRPSSLIIDEVIAREGAKCASHQPLVYSGVKGNSSFEAEMPLNTHGSHKKGILKRNPRGCRGPCACLNCASFRLHAERAFEFSRNQFLDAEEIALDVVKELSHLRNLLERSIDSAGNQSVLDENEVKEACMKASAVEKLVRDRLSQMNDDLNVHCRITCSQQPRVRFANHIEEKVISPDDGVSVEVFGGVEPEVELLLSVSFALCVDIGVKNIRVTA
ncbi:uncharacterized protein G2W53_005538 [Senna tora]|uniref:Uncharacterized protein n=1 Tax=Senna tora TaxID=362788 RepID=A0A835CBA7_9FABA|nr:uncharacterized protein G2W53_005538 [Senna tora]